MSVAGFPLSPQQRRVWRLQGAGAASPYRVRYAAEIAPAAAAGLRAALAAVAGRHEILRTTFRALPGMELPLQVIGSGGGIPLAEEDLAPLAPAAQQARIAAGITDITDIADIAGIADVADIADIAGTRPGWDFAAGPLAAAELLRLGPERFVLIVEASALCLDALGMEHLLAEIGRELAPGGSARAGAEEPLQYPDLSTWLNETLESDDTQAGRDFWRQQDLSAAATAGLPFAHRPSGDFSPRIAAVPLPALDRAAMAATAAAAERCGVPLEAWLLACWQALLARWTGSRELVVGVACDGRAYAELQDVPGLLARVLPLACTVAEEQSVASLAREAAADAARLVRWQSYFSWEALETAALPAASPGVPFLPFAFELWPGQEPSEGSPLSPAFLREACLDRFLLKLRADLGAGGISLSLGYDAVCLDRVDVERVAGSLALLLADAAQRPEAAAGDLDMASDLDISGIAKIAKAADTVHGRFERHAAAHPEAPAVRWEETCWTYGELDRRAGRLAGRLRRLGVGPEVRVALCLDRSAEIVAALLAVLKAGGAYVPLDPQLPAERLAVMVRDSGAAVAVVQEHYEAALAGSGARLLRLDEAAEAPDGEPAGPGAGADPGNLVYVMYTSGSTGLPKGVAVEHRQILAYVDGLAAALGALPGASQASVSTFAADLGNTTLFSALCGGGCLHVVAQERITDPEAFAEYAERHPADVLKIVPGHLQALLSATRPERVLPRRRLVLGGEKLSRDLVRRVRSLAPACEVINHYGPTETTVGVMALRLGGPEAAAGQEAGAEPPVPLGPPLPHCEVLLLNPWLRLCPPGVTGEIYIGGEGISRGYFGRPAATAERFVPHPFSPRPGERLYRTGDLGRERPDGTVDFLGRADRQIKLRGFRVELEEIERTLALHPSVLQAVVALREDSGDPRLAAYLVPAADGAGAADLKAHLRSRLPEYMVPAAFVFLPALPLTPNGKVDHRALPAPEAGAGALGAAAGARNAPRNPVEEILADLWRELLGVERVALEDNFFDLGGHSLLAMQLNARIGRLLGIDLPLGTVFEARSLAALAGQVEDALAGGRGLGAPPLAPSGVAGDSPLSFAQERHWILQQLDLASPLYNLRGVLRIDGALRPRVLAAVFAEIARRHAVLRACFPVVDGRPVQRVEPAAGPFGIDLPLIDLREVPAPAREDTARHGATQIGLLPFALDRAPMLRLALLRLGDEEHLLALTFHHIVADRWTIGVLTREMAALYTAFAAGRPSPLPPLRLQYSDYARWQREWMRGEVLERQIAVWREALAGAPPVLDLAIARHRPARLSGRSARLPVPLPEGLGARLEALSRGAEATLFQTLVAAFQVLLGWYGGSDDVVVGSPVANRTRVETEGLIGCFINALALRARLQPDLTFCELLARSREFLLRAYTHQDVPFERLVQALQPERVAGATPIFQVVFNFANEGYEPIEIPGLRFSPGKRDEVMEGKYDLILTMVGGSGGLQAVFTYSLDLFESTGVGRMAAAFVFLLVQVAEDPGLRLAELGRRLAAEDRRLRLAGGQEVRTQRERKLANARRQAVPTALETSR